MFGVLQKSAFGLSKYIVSNLAGNAQDIVVPPVEGLAGGGTAYGWNDGATSNSYWLKESIDPSEIPTADLVHVWCLPSTENVGQQEMPRHLEPVRHSLEFCVLV